MLADEDKGEAALINFGIHKDISVRVGAIGEERQPIIMVDNFIDRPESLVACAENGEALHVTQGLYPGLRATVPDAYMALVEKSLGDLICQTFRISPQNVADVASYFSIVTTPRSQLKLPQSIPHIDGENPNDIAFLHYLCDEKYGGTSFYRHRSTGYEYIDQRRFPAYVERLEQEIKDSGSAHAGRYMNGDTDLFERIASIEARFNRLIIYRGTSLHSGDIGQNYAFDANPLTGRLTITSFLYSAV